MHLWATKFTFERIIGTSSFLELWKLEERLLWFLLGFVFNDDTEERVLLFESLMINEDEVIMGWRRRVSN